MTKPHPRGCCAVVWGCGHGPETPGWSRSGSFDLSWRDVPQIDVIHDVIAHAIHLPFFFFFFFFHGCTHAFFSCQPQYPSDLS